jgi:hypothetical protein
VEVSVVLFKSTQPAALANGCGELDFHLGSGLAIAGFILYIIIKSLLVVN